jgi:hypothetical protein
MLGLSSSPAFQTAVALAVSEVPSRSLPRPEGRKGLFSTASDPAVASRASVDRLLRTEPQVCLWRSITNNCLSNFVSQAAEAAQIVCRSRCRPGSAMDQVNSNQ